MGSVCTSQAIPAVARPVLGIAVRVRRAAIAIATSMQMVGASCRALGSLACRVATALDIDMRAVNTRSKVIEEVIAGYSRCCGTNSYGRFTAALKALQQACDTSMRSDCRNMEECRLERAISSCALQHAADQNLPV